MVGGYMMGFAKCCCGLLDDPYMLRQYNHYMGVHVGRGNQLTFIQTNSRRETDEMFRQLVASCCHHADSNCTALYSNS